MRMSATRALCNSTSRATRRRIATASILLCSWLAALPSPAADIATDVEGCLRRLSSEPRRYAASLPAPLRIAVWNSRKFEREGAVDMLQQLAAESDLLLLQESIEAAPQTDHTWRLFAPGYQRGGRRSGVELRARVAADVRCTLQFREPWLRTPKAVAVGRFALGERASLLVITLHAVNFTFGIADYRMQLSALGRLLKTHRGPALVAGDFNHWNDARATALAAFMETNDLQQLPIDPDRRSRHLGRPVDAVLLHVIRGVAGTARVTESSDHHPITATLLWPPSPDASAGSDAAGN